MRNFEQSLDVLIGSMNRRSCVAHKQFVETVIHPTFMLGLSTKFYYEEDKVNRFVRRYLTIVARKLAKVFKRRGHKLCHRHLFWEGWYDCQPNRVEDVYHYHLFVELEGVGFNDLNPTDLAIIKNVFNKEWRYGIVELDSYKRDREGIRYTVNKHEHPINGISCNNGQNKCKRNDCFYGEHIEIIYSRRTIDKKQ